MSKIEVLLHRYGHLPLILDTNLLLVLCVGNADPSFIAKHKRTSGYSRQDFDLLRKVVSRFRRIVATPHIFTEVSNLAAQIPESLRIRVMGSVAALILRLEEAPLKSSDIAAEQAFLWFGLTDVGIGLLAKDEYLVITDDAALASRLHSLGVHCLNFNYLRTDYLTS